MILPSGIRRFAVRTAGGGVAGLSPARAGGLGVGFDWFVIAAQISAVSNPSEGPAVTNDNPGVPVAVVDHDLRDN